MITLFQSIQMLCPTAIVVLLITDQVRTWDSARPASLFRRRFLAVIKRIVLGRA